MRHETGSLGVGTVLRTARIIWAAVLVIGAAGIGACADENPPHGQLGGTAWEMTHVAEGAELSGAAPIHIITLSFSNDRASGFDGCNDYFFEYEATDVAIDFDEPSITGRSCPPADPPSQGDAFLAALEQVAQYSVGRSELTLSDSGSRVLIKLRPASELPLAPVSWRLESYRRGDSGMESPLDGAPVTLAFTLDGTFTGHTGCNRYGGVYEIQDGRLRLRNITSDARVCEDPPEAMRQEADFLALLGDVDTFHTTLTTLELRTGERLVMELRFGGRVR